MTKIVVLTIRPLNFKNGLNDLSIWTVPFIYEVVIEHFPTEQQAAGCTGAKANTVAFVASCLI